MWRMLEFGKMTNAIQTHMLNTYDGWMDGYFVYRRSTLKGHIASNKFYVI